MHPVIARTVRRSGQRRAIRRMRDGARNNPLDARLAQTAETARRRVPDTACRRSRLRRDQFALKIPRRRPRPSIHAHRRSRTGPSRMPVPSCGNTQCVQGSRTTGSSRRVADQLRHRLGDQVVMQHIGDRRAMAGPGRPTSCNRSRRHSPHARKQVALLGVDQPFAGVKLPDAGHASAADRSRRRARAHRRPWPWSHRRERHGRRSRCRNAALTP